MSTNMVMEASDFLWDPDLITEDLLPTTLFGADFPLIDTSSSTPPPKTGNFSRFTSRLPQLDDAEDGMEHDTGNEAEIGDQVECATITRDPTWSVTSADYERLCLVVQAYSNVLPIQCSMPSKNNLFRYIDIYLRCTQKFLPFIHVATFSVEQMDIELILAVAANGSLYAYETAKAYELYSMSRAILLERIRVEDLQLTSELLSGQSHLLPDKMHDIRRVQTFILLINFASWADRKLSPDALSMGSQLAVLVKRSGISTPDEMPPDIDWLSWVAIEERRRTLLAAYVVFNLHSIAFDVPPLILNLEVGVFLPGSAEQWSSENAAQWGQADRQVDRQFQAGLRCLLDGTGIPKDESVSSFANYLLIHALLQQIYINRHGSLGRLQQDAIEGLETALRTWQSSWELTNESSLDPTSPKGPFGLSATALLRLSYIRLNSDINPCQGLLSGDLSCIMDIRSDLNRSSHSDRTILQAAHALGLLVRFGIPLMARASTPIWTIEHSLCSLQCAMLLKDWLEMISTIVRTCGTDGLRNSERKLLMIITEIIRETCVAPTLDLPDDDASRIQRMGSTVAKIWAAVFQGVHILEIDNVIKAGLQLLSESTPD